MFAHIHPHAPHFHANRTRGHPSHPSTINAVLLVIAAFLLAGIARNAVQQTSSPTSPVARLSPQLIGAHGLAAGIQLISATHGGLSTASRTPVQNPSQQTGAPMSSVTRLRPEQIGARGLAAEARLESSGGNRSSSGARSTAQVH